MSKPIIGVTTASNPDLSRTRSAYFRVYAAAIKEAGGIPVYITPNKSSKKRPEDFLDNIDGLLLTGGLDIHLSRYESIAETDIAALCRKYSIKPDPVRDASEIPLTILAYEAQMPILGICRGMQVLNVALGGSLIKDIDSWLRHRAHTAKDIPLHKNGESAKHSVRLKQESHISRIIGEDEIIVNSRHHQGMTGSELSGSLIQTAVAEDQTIEAVEGIDHPWAIGVQWHPERANDSYIYHPCRKLFQSFIKAAEDYR